MNQQNIHLKSNDYRFFPYHTGIGAKALILKDDKVLVLFKKNGAPDLPGGRVEKESILEGLIREIEEETKTSIVIELLLSRWSFLKNTNKKILGYTYLCRYVEGPVQISEEHKDFFWVNANEIHEIDFHPSYGLDQISIDNIVRWQENERFWSLPQINFRKGDNVHGRKKMSDYCRWRCGK